MTKPLEQLRGVVGDKSPEDSDFRSITISTLLSSTSVSFQMSVQRCYLQSTLTTLLQMTKH